MQAVRNMCEKALYLEQGKVVSFLPVDEAVTEYSRSIDSDNLKGWGKTRLDPDNFDDTAHCDIPNKINCEHAEIINQQGEITSSLAIENNFYIDITYTVVEDLQQTVTPNIHFYDEFGGRFFISLPDQSSPKQKGTYTARCEIPPYLFNIGRYSAMIAISSFALDHPHYFAYENALCFEIYESGLIDPRRHGWSGALPGVSRARLDWQYK
jgi:lipopolysaccharide transport system ATP-binding protein